MFSQNGHKNGRKPGGSPYAHIVGWGMAVPDRVLTNEQISRMVATTDEWISSRTGIRERRIAGPRDTTASLGLQAARQAMTVAGVNPKDVDLIIVATSSPEYVFPSTGSIIQDALGATHAGAFDLSAACSGFMYALALGSSMIRCGALQTVLVIGSETLSRLVNWQDRETCILFGDGAGAFVLQAREQPGGVIASVLGSDGSGGDLLKVPAGGSKLPASVDTVRDNLHYISMNGREVFRFAARVMVSAAKEVLADAELQLADISLIIPHQANIRIIQSAARGLGLPEERFMVNLDRYGNTSTASIPIAVCEAVSQGRVQPGDNIMLVGFGAGLTWGATLLNWAAAGPPEVSRWAQVRRQSLYAFARMRSVARRGWRRLEGTVWGSEGPARVRTAGDEEEDRKPKPN